jgi:hypothetical protein
MWQHSFAGSSSANGGSPLNFDFGSVGKIAGYTEYEAQDGQAWTANYTDANNWSALAVNDGRIAIHINPAFRYASKADYEAGKDLSGSIPVTLKVYMPMDPTTYYTIGGKRGANAPRRAITSSLTLSPEIEVEGNVTQSIVLSDAAIVTGIDEVAADAADQAPVYYNLQGIRVENPQAGQVYIEVRGRRATKTFIR